jgi:lysophospholipid acyltransferase (LPLAT)-like uncharacterized protein
MRPPTVTESGRASVATRKRTRLHLAKRVARAPFGVGLVGGVLSAALKFVYATNRVSFEPPIEDVFAENAPFILACWHGQGFALPMVRPSDRPVDVLASKSKDADIIARAMSNLGLGIIRGAGSSDPTRMIEKGSIEGFRGMKAALDGGHTVALTADFMPNARRKASPGLILLARITGRPIVPVAIASSRRLTFNSWDRTTISLPFGRTACVGAEPIFVPRRAEAAELEALRLELEQKLNLVYDRAYEIADGKRG